MEIERYTLATGETALTGFSRFWRHWGLVFASLAYFANIWPGWVSSSSTLVTYLVGGSVVPFAIGMLLVIGITLTMAPVVYQAFEKIEFFKVDPPARATLAVSALPRPAARVEIKCTAVLGRRR